jgi:tRNA 2-(methylsulfanyl)-N6-isopentenyladenosine37 hydroxylase
MLHLSVPSDPAWVACALGDIDAVLVDHAHCEMKAASNALSMAARHPDDPTVVRILMDVAREEIDHFQRVHALLEARGVALGTPPVDPYVAALRRVQTQIGPSPVTKNAAAVDRLLTCALIEARSCERFDLLAKALAPRDEDLAAFYAELRTSEARHYRTFIDLAVRTAGGDEASVFGRLEAFARAEGVIVEGLATADVRSAIHG